MDSEGIVVLDDTGGMSMVEINKNKVSGQHHKPLSN